MATDTPRDIKLTDDYDWDVSAGDLAILTGADAIVQSVKLHLQFFKGEWFLDLDAGIPYFQDVLIKNPDPNLLQSVFRNALLAIPGVLEIISLSLAIDNETRTLAIDMRLSTDVGELDIQTEV